MSAPRFTEELRRAYTGRRVLITGHTGFKGSWLTLWLAELGAEVTGLALPPETKPALFDVMALRERCQHVEGDIRDPESTARIVREVRPEFVFHLAAQSLVSRSYAEPLPTVQTNVLGTAALLEAIRLGGRPCAAVMVASDKCYENREWVWGYREDDALGGHDVYSGSKGAAEIITASYRRSFFPPARLCEHQVAIGSARAGNVIGGGDWADNRIVPDTIRALSAERLIPVRNPDAVRPWQHVLEPLGGYLLLGARLAAVGTKSPERYCEAWNFGPATESTRRVGELVEAIVGAWGKGNWEDQHDPSAPHEASTLRLAIEKSITQLGWTPTWGFEATVARTVEWYRLHASGGTGEELLELSIRQIQDYCGMFGQDGRERRDERGRTRA
jgi:CDP-glucose 4,6-dehydratase